MTTLCTCRNAPSDVLADWVLVRCKPNHDRMMTGQARQRWTKPQQGMLKCNVDAACYNAENKYSTGACLRDVEVKFVQACTSHFEGQPEIKEAEAQGLLVTLQWLKQIHIDKVEIEMDCM
ncbi:cytochrome P450 [Trifolium medium]|uniref:Cytochrome P450 n=1 Tax=Trifolium medium TaxID=97028 RepID=A0A392NER7_9FABA|nr:cytochrome P450 [Trifolium medium]